MNETRVSWLSTAGVIANGGFRPPGTEGMKASTGSAKPKTAKVKKVDPYRNVGKPVETRQADKPVETRQADKPVTGGRVTQEGMYRFGDTLARVKISANGHPYVLVKNKQGGWDYEGKAPLATLRASDRIDEVAVAQGTPAPKITEGWYKHGDTVAEVVKGKRGYLYATELDMASGRFVFVSGLVRQLDPAARLTLAEAVAMGKRFHRCMCCGRELTNPDSIDRGIGPICAGKL